jgi:hypothetical protein
MTAVATCRGCGVDLHGISEVERHRCPGSKATRSKYRVAAKAKRTYNGVTYHSALEMRRAKELDVERGAGYVIDWFRQPRKPIGCEEIVSDFIVIQPGGIVEIEEVKGHVTADWARHLRWWRANGRLPLVVLTAEKGGGWNREVVKP